MPLPSSWSDLGAIAQSITAAVSIFVAFLAYRYSRKQTAINASLIINNAWNDINKFGIQSFATKRAFEVVSAPISTENDGYEFDAVIFMHLNIQEMYYYMNRNGVIAKNDYAIILKEAGKMLANVPNLGSYLNRGYNPVFAASITQSVKERLAAIGNPCPSAIKASNQS